MYLQIRNTTISRINIYNPYIHIIHILACFFTSIYPNRFTSNVVHLYRFSKLFSQFFNFPPSRLVVHEGTNHMQPKGGMWLAALPPLDLGLHPLALDCTPWPWITPLDLGLDRMKRELPWHFWPPKSILVSRSMLCLIHVSFDKS